MLPSVSPTTHRRPLVRSSTSRLLSSRMSRRVVRFSLQCFLKVSFHTATSFSSSLPMTKEGLTERRDSEGKKKGGNNNNNGYSAGYGPPRAYSKIHRLKKISRPRFSFCMIFWFTHNRHHWIRRVRQGCLGHLCPHLWKGH